MENFSTSNEKFIDRLELFIQEEGLNNNQLTVRANLSNGLIGKALKSRTAMNSDSIENILYAFPRLNADWLMTGRGEMFCSAGNGQTPKSDLTNYLEKKVHDLETKNEKLLAENIEFRIKLGMEKDSSKVI